MPYGSWLPAYSNLNEEGALHGSLIRIRVVLYPITKRKPYGWQVLVEGLLKLWAQPYHPRPQVDCDAAGVTTRGIRPHAPVNYMVLFLCHGFIKFMYINKI